MCRTSTHRRILLPGIALAAALGGAAPLAAMPQTEVFAQRPNAPALAVEIIRPPLVSRYGRNVEVTARVVAATGLPAAVSWRVLDAPLSGSLITDELGHFAFHFPTAGLPDLIYVEVTATAPTGITAQRYVALLGPRSGLPAAIVSPGPSRGEAVPTPVEDERPPALSILSPPQGAECGASVRVTGTAVGLGAPLARLSWRLAAAGLGEEIPVQESGGFSFEVNTEGVQDAFAVTVRAEDRRGRLTERSLGLRRDRTGPVLSVSSPADGQHYEGELIVQGRISDSPGPPWSVDSVRSLSWRLIGSGVAEESVQFSADGSFRFLAPVAGLTGPLILELRGLDTAGNVSVAALRLSPAPAASPARSEAAVRAAPLLRVTSPTVDSLYASRVLVQGSVANSETDPAADRVASLDWALQGTDRRGRLVPRPDGGFSFEVPTNDLQGTLALQLTARSTDGSRTELLLALLDDGRGPGLVLHSGGQAPYYRDRILLEGRIGDPADSPESLSEVRSLSYRIGASDGIPLPYEADGTFLLSIPATGFSGPQTLRLTAEDRNGHRTERLLRLEDGKLKPSVLISEPADGSPYGSRLRVRGRIIDPYDGVPGMEGIAAVSYEAVSREVYTLARSPAQGAVTVGEDNTFDFIVPTGVLSGPQEIRVSVTATSGNQAQAVVALEEAEADIPSFTVACSAAGAVADWGELPGTDQYTLLFWKENPDWPPEQPTRLAGVRPPHRLEGLEPGNLYGLRLLATASSEADSWSVTRWIIPVRPETLRPVVAGEYGQIRISWPALPGSREYRVWRSAGSENGEYSDISGSVSDTVHVDTQVRFGLRYYYRITPAGYPESRSAASWAETTPFPEKRAVLRGESPCEGARQVSLSGDYALLSAGARGVRVIDVGAPEAPAEVGVIPAQAAFDVTVAGSTAYVADGPYGLKVFDIAEPRAPVQIGFRDTSDARRVVLRGNLAIVGDGERGLKIIDVSRATDPVRVASLDTTAAFDLALRGDLLYVASGTQGLRVIDLTDPLNPRDLGGCATRDARRLALQDGLAFVADAQQGLAILDLSDPAHPLPVGGYHTPDTVDVSVSGRFAYLADAGAGLVVLDISDPYRPSQFAQLPLAGASGLAVRGSLVYLAGAAGLQTVHVVNEGTSHSVASCPVPGGAYALSVVGDQGYVSAHGAGLQVVDLSSPAALDEKALRAGVPTDYALHVAVLGRLAYVADGRRGIKIVDTSAHEVSSYFTGGSAWRLAAEGKRLYVADGADGLKVLDLSDPLNPVELAAISTADARDVCVSGGFLYLADGQGGLRIFDLAAEGRPQEIGSLEQIDARRVVVAANLACVGGPEGVALVSVQDPRKPARIGSYATPHVEGIDISGACLYVAEGHKGLSVLDVSRPGRPEVISRCREVYAVDVVVKGEFAFVPDADRLHAIRVLIPRWLQPGLDGDR